MHSLSPRKKRLIRIVAVVAGINFLLFGLLIAAGIMYGDKAKELIVTEINRNLLVPVEIGEVDFTVLQSFPDASVVFRNVEMKTSPLLPEAPGLMHAARISLRFGLFSLLTDNYKIRSLEINQASITLWTNASGKDNFQVWKKGKTTTGSGVSFDLQRVSIRNSEIYYRNISKKTDIAIAIPGITLKGKMGRQKHELAVKGSFLANRLQFDGIEYAPSAITLIDASVMVDELAHNCSITNASLNFAGIPFRISGSLGYDNVRNPVNLTLSAKDADIEDAMKALPPALSKSFKGYEPGGSLTVAAKISGKWGKSNLPPVSLNFSLEEGSFTHRESGSRITDIAASGQFRSRNGALPGKLELRSFSGNTREGKIKGRMSLVDFRKPKIDLKFSADIELEEIQGFIGTGNIRDIQGNLVADVTYKGTFDSGKRMAEIATGQVRLSNTSFQIAQTNLQFKDINGQFELKNGRVYVDGLQVQAGESILNLSGYFNNLIGWVFFTDQPLYFEVQLVSPKLRLEDLMAMSSQQSDSSGTTSIFPKGLSFNASFSIGDFSYKKFSAKKAAGNLTLDDNVLRAGNLAFKAVDGNITADGVLNGRYGNRAQVVCNARFSDVDITRLFYEFSDFGQKSLQSRHLKGRADATVQYSSSLNTRFETDASSVSAVADLEIRNGQLLKFEPLQELSRFLDVEALKSVKFSTIRNRIEIVRKTVIIPEMDIKSTALNLQGYGSHTFSNDIDYHFSVLTSDLRKNKRMKNPPPPTAIEDDGLGRTRLFLHMTGTVANPVIKYDRMAVAKKITDDFKQEKKTLRNVLKQEFSRNKPPPEEKKVKPVQFEIEWDEDK